MAKKKSGRPRKQNSERFTHWHCKHCGREESLESQTESEGINYYFGHAFWAFSCYFDEDSEPRIRLEGKTKPRSADGARRAEAFIEAGIERVGWWHLLGARGELSGKEWPLAYAGAADYCWLGVSEEEGLLAVVYDLPDVGSFSEVHLLFPEGDELRASNLGKPPAIRSPISRQLYDPSLGEGDLVARVREARENRSAQPVCLLSSLFGGAKLFEEACLDVDFGNRLARPSWVNRCASTADRAQLIVQAVE